MSRVAKNPVLIPDNVKLAVENNKVIVEGPKGKDELTINKDISVVQEDSSVTIKYDESISTQVAIAGTTRALINNMVIGVNIGFEKKLELVGVGYRAKLNGNTLDLTLGFSHPIKHQLPENVTAETPSQTEIILNSHNKQLLGQTAAEIRAYRPPEPYKGKGVKYVLASLLTVYQFIVFFFELKSPPFLQKSFRFLCSNTSSPTLESPPTDSAPIVEPHLLGGLRMRRPCG